MRINNIYSPVTINFSAADRARIKFELLTPRKKQELIDAGIATSTDFEINNKRHFVFVNADNIGTLEEKYGVHVRKCLTLEDQMREAGFTPNLPKNPENSF